VLWHLTMSPDGFIAGPNHEMAWMSGISFRPGLVDEYIETTGAVLGGRHGWDAAGDSRRTVAPGTDRSSSSPTTRRTRRPPTQGLGLGLYLARGIVEAHGGILNVESHVGAGTTFRLAVPLIAARLRFRGHGGVVRGAYDQPRP